MRRVRLHHEGRGILISFFLIALLACWATWSFVPFWGVFAVTLLVSLVVLSLAINFFRFPTRHNSESQKDNLLVAPADGEVVVIEEVTEHEFIRGRCLKLSIFMSLYNVHANWAACNGTIQHVEHQPGAYYRAFLPKSCVLNERSAIVIRTPGGHEVLERQIAGAIARRIITYPQVGEQVTTEDFIGFIKFGSRIDLYLPLGTNILVRVGDKVTGCTTTLGYLPS